MHRLLSPPRLLLALALVTSAAAPTFAQRSVAGVDDEEDEGEKKPAEEAKPDEAKPDDKDAKKDPKKDPKKDKKKDEKKPDEKKPDEKTTKKATPDDVLEDSAEDKAKRKSEDAAREKADAAAAAADKKKAEDKAKADEEKKAAAEKRRIDTREQRLSSAKKVRSLVREEGDINIALSIEPGAVVKDEVVEVRFDIGRVLDVADPKFGNREPLKNLKLTATVSEGSGKKGSSRVFAVHSLGAPGAYGFHLTPSKDGALQVQLLGDVGDRTINVSFPLHVGVWPPPDFDDEDKKLVAKGS